jgi:hypothetical protein
MNEYGDLRRSAEGKVYTYVLHTMGCAKMSFVDASLAGLATTIAASANNEVHDPVHAILYTLPARRTRADAMAQRSPSAEFAVNIVVKDANGFPVRVAPTPTPEILVLRQPRRNGSETLLNCLTALFNCICEHDADAPSSSSSSSPSTFKLAHQRELGVDLARLLGRSAAFASARCVGDELVCDV